MWSKQGFSNVILDIYNNVGSLAIFGWIAFFYLAVHVSFVNRKCTILYNDANRPIVIQTLDNGASRKCFFSSTDGHTVPCGITGTSNFFVCTIAFLKKCGTCNLKSVIIITSK